MSKAMLRLFAVGLLFPAGCATPAFVAKWMPGSKPAVTPPPQLAHHAPQQPAPQRPASSLPWTNAGQPASNSPRPSGAPWQTVADQLEQAYQSETGGRLTEARIAYERVLQSDAQHAYANHRLAIIADKEGRFADSERHYSNAYWANPKNADLLSDWGYSYQLQGRDDLSVRVLQEALKLDGAHRNALYNLGQIYAKNGDAQHALSLFKSAGSSEAEAQRALAQITPRNAPALPTTPELAAGLQNPFLPQNQRVATVSGQANGDSQRLTPSTGDTLPSTQQYANEHERQLAEFIAKRRAEQQDSKRTVALPGSAARPSAPPPGSAPRPPHIDGNLADHRQLSPEQRQQIALEYLRNQEVHPAEIKRRLAEVDSQFGNDVTQANRPRNVADAPAIAGNNGQAPWSTDRPWPQTSSFAAPANTPSNPSSLPQYVPQLSSQNPATWPSPSTATTAGAWNDGPSNKVSPAGGTLPTAPQPSTPATQAGNAWENARSTAAQMGMSAGAGQLFPAPQSSPLTTAPQAPAPQIPPSVIAPTLQMSPPQNWPAPGLQQQPWNATVAPADTPFTGTPHNSTQHPPGVVINLPAPPNQLQPTSPAATVTQPPLYPHAGQPPTTAAPQIQPQSLPPQYSTSQPGQLPLWPGRQ